MNKMVAYAKAATIRERQLEEKQRDWEDFKTQEKKKDKIMELERLKKIKEQEEIEVRKKEEALRGREVIVDQIKQREIDRLKQREEQEKEAQILVQRMKEMEREEKLKLEVTYVVILEKEGVAAQNERGNQQSQQKCHAGHSAAEGERAGRRRQDRLVLERKSGKRSRSHCRTETN